MIFDKLYEEAQSNSVGFYEYNPTITDEIRNGVGSLLSGAYTGIVAKPSIFLGGALVSGMETLDDIAGMESDSSQTQFLKNSLAATVKHTQLMQETAANSGQLDSAIFSVSDVLSSFIGAGKFAKGVGGVSVAAGTVQGYADYEQGLAEGLDPLTAAEKGTISGGAVALSGYIPLTMGFKFSPVAKSVIESQTKLSKAFAYGSLIAQDVTYTAGANIAIGAGYRGFTHEILKANGYDQMADQYKALDDSSMMIDAAFGIIFGGVAKHAEIRNHNAIDALLAKNNQIHQADSAMGVPSDIHSMNAHDMALNKAFDDMINGRAVDVESILKDTNYILKDNIDWNSKVLEAITKQFPDEAVFYSQNNTPIPGRIINEIRSQLLSESSNLIKTTERKKIAQEIHDLMYKAEAADKERLDLITKKRESSRGKQGAQERQHVAKEADRLNNLSKTLRKQALEKQEYLKNHTRGGKSFDAKADLSRLEQGIIPERFIGQIIEKTGMKGNKADLLKINNELNQNVSDSEFRAMQEKAEYQDQDSGEAISNLLKNKPDMEIKYIDDMGVESSVKASELMESVNRELEQAQADKKLYDAAVTCMLRNL